MIIALAAPATFGQERRHRSKFGRKARTAAIIAGGAATGGLIGALVGAGIPEHRAKVYDAGIRGGGILLGVEARSDDNADQLQKFLEDLGAEHVRQE
jgi:hypothetical protein